MKLKCWNDVNWEEEEEWESISRFIFILTDDTIIYSSKKQDSIVFSFIELKYMIILHIFKKQIWFLHFIKEIDYDINN